MTTLVVKIPNLQQLVGEITWGHNILRQTQIGVATYQLYPQVPSEYQGLLPTDSDGQRFKKSALPFDFSGTVEDN